MCLAIPGRILDFVTADLVAPDPETLGASGADVDALRLARVDFGGAVRRISLAYLPEADVGDWVIVHAGFALSVQSAEDAAATLELLDQLGLPDEGTAS